MLGYTRSVWRPAPRTALGQSDDKILGMPSSFLWGGAGFVTGLGAAVVVDVFFKEPPVPVTIIGPLSAALIGALLFLKAKQPKRALPWAIGATIPAAVQMAYGMLFPKAAGTV